ncbi:hypothetical protein HK104_007338, partial [Borealophlyctis nickersoniae]
MSWMLCIMILTALSAWPIMIILNPEETDSPTTPWTSLQSYYLTTLQPQFSTVSPIAFVALWCMVNREMLILLGLSLFVRWPPAVTPEEVEKARREAKKRAPREGEAETL